MTDIEDRINECMQRSMNGAPLPMDSAEMIAMAAYLRSLGSQYEAMGRRAEGTSGAGRLQRAIAQGRRRGRAGRVRREVQHLSMATMVPGFLLPKTAPKGYLFPPLWGPDSFNDGAGMHRVLTAARFIKARMPLGEPDLTDDEAFDVAAYINNQPRPEMPNLEKDYPDLSVKQIDSPYGPFADDFPIEQHRFGPFPPIAAYYESLKTR